MAADIDLATKTSGVVDVDLWYSNVYELYNSGINFARYAEIQDIFENKVKIMPRLLTNKCEDCSAKEKKKTCI